VEFLLVCFMGEAGVGGIFVLVPAFVYWLLSCLVLLDNFLRRESETSAA